MAEQHSIPDEENENVLTIWMVGVKNSITYHFMN